MYTRLLRGCAACLRVTRLVLLVAMPAMSVLASPSAAQDMPAPVELQVRLLARILQFDRRFPDGFGGEIVVGVLYQSRFRASLDAMRAASSALEDEHANGSVGGIPLRVVPLDLDGGLSLADALADEQIDVLYVSPLRSVEIGTVSQVSRDKGVLTFTGVPEYVRLGLAVSVGSRGGRPEILINIAAAAAEGVVFSSELLQIANLVEGSADELDAFPDPAEP